MTKQIKAFKAFNSDFSCRGFKYTVGATYKHEGKVEACASGFHSCVNPIDILRFYPPTGKIATVVASEDISEEDDKISSSEIYIEKELSVQEFVQACIENAKGDVVASNSGNYSVASNSGNYSVASNSGYKSVASNSGYKSVASNSGNYSVASNTSKNGVAVCNGNMSRAKGSKGCVILIVNYDDNANVKHHKSGLIDNINLFEDVEYCLDDKGEFIKYES